MKKIASLFLALVMALALAVPAFATSGTVKVDGSIQMPTINVVLPTTASLILNPYEMSVKLNPKDTTASTDQIISTPMQVKNLSDIGVKVEVTVQGTTGKGTVEFATSSAASVTNAKKAYIYGVFEVGDADDTITEPASLPSSGAAVLAAGTTPAPVPGFTSTDPQAPANTLNPVSTDDKKNPAPGGVLNFQFFGDTSDVTDWTDKDTLGATVAFKFIPVAGAVSAPSAGDATVTVAISGTSATATFNAGTSGLTATSYAWASDNAAKISVAGTTASATITEESGSSSGDSAEITVTVTLSNGATITGSDTYSIS